MKFEVTQGKEKLEVNMEKSLKINIFGRVQGVSFRYYTQQKARELGIRGYVKNMPDGSVYIEATGKEDQMDQFVDFCRQGPSMARVENLEMENTGAVREETFVIK